MADDQNKSAAGGTHQDGTSGRRSETQGLLRFGREMGWALAMALVFIIYVIQAFKIPTGSMEDSLLVHDYLLGLKFVYGAPILPFWHRKLPGLMAPRPGDVIIFRYPGLDKKDYIKRCVAGPGQTVRIHQKLLIVDGDTLRMPPKGKHMSQGILPRRDHRAFSVRRRGAVVKGDTVVLGPGDTTRYDTLVELPGRVVELGPGDSAICPDAGPCVRDDRIVAVSDMLVDQRLVYFAPLRIPAKGDTIRPDSLPLREFIYLRHLVGQENPGAKVRTVMQLYVDGAYANDRLVRLPGLANSMAFDDIPWDRVDSWTDIDDIVQSAREKFAGQRVEVRWFLELNGARVTQYVVKKDCYFMMGDNRDNSLDSRYWGYLSRNNVKAKALILYFSHDAHTPWVLLPLKIRWNRIGKLIRSWDGRGQSRTAR